MSNYKQNQDLRKQQLTLLKYEKTIKNGALVLGAGGAVAAANADKVLGGEAAAALADLREAHMALAQKASEAHDVLGMAALEAGARVSDGGLPKETINTVVKSLLGLG